MALDEPTGAGQRKGTLPALARSASGEPSPAARQVAGVPLAAAGSAGLGAREFPPVQAAHARAAQAPARALAERYAGAAPASARARARTQPASAAAATPPAAPLISVSGSRVLESVRCRARGAPPCT